VAESEGRPYVVMELVEGRSLAAILEHGALAPRQAAELVRDLARALAHAHEKGVVHRDVKPANVLVGEDGRPHLVDLGLALDELALGCLARDPESRLKAEELAANLEAWLAGLPLASRRSSPWRGHGALVVALAVLALLVLAATATVLVRRRRADPRPDIAAR